MLIYYIGQVVRRAEETSASVAQALGQILSKVFESEYEYFSFL